MKRGLITFLLLLSINCFGQSVYLGLKTGMTKKDAKIEYDSKSDDYKYLNIGNGVQFVCYKQNFQYINDTLFAVLLVDNFAANLTTMSQYNAKVYMTNTVKFFQLKGWEIDQQSKYWDIPILWNGELGVIMKNLTDDRMVHIYYTKFINNRYLVNLYFRNYSSYKKVRKLLDDVEDIRIQNEKL